MSADSGGSNGPGQADAYPGPSTDELFRAAMGSFASGVTVVTCTRGGADHAMTASAFSSVSMDPPIVLICVNRHQRFWRAISEAESWAVSILDQAAQPHANWLATSGRPLVGQLKDVPHSRTRLGNPILEQSLARFECSTIEQIRAGDHDIFLGEVLWADRGTGTDPLIYWRSAYRKLEDSSD